MKIAAIAGLGSVLVLGALAGCGDDDNGSNDGTGGGDASAGMGGGGGSGGGTAGSGGSGGGTAGSGGSGGGTAGSGGATGDAGDAAAATVSFGGGVVEYVQGSLGSESPAEGVEVCVVDADGSNVSPENCDTTDASGTYSLSGLEPGSRVILLFTKDGYASQAVALSVGTMDVANAVVVRMAAAVAAGDAGDAGTAPNIGIDPSVVLDPANGLMNVFAVQASASPDAGMASPGFDWTTGVSFTITPASGDGPFYINADETWASGATSTMGTWGAWFVNLPPGEYSVSASHATMNCVPAGGRFGWAETDGTATAPVIAGINTQSIGFFCSEPPGDAGADGG